MCHTYDKAEGDSLRHLWESVRSEFVTALLKPVIYVCGNRHVAI